MKNSCASHRWKMSLKEREAIAWLWFALGTLVVVPFAEKTILKSGFPFAVSYILLFLSGAAVGSIFAFSYPTPRIKGAKDELSCVQFKEWLQEWKKWRKRFLSRALLLLFFLFVIWLLVHSERGYIQKLTTEVVGWGTGLGLVWGRAYRNNISKVEATLEKEKGCL